MNVAIAALCADMGMFVVSAEDFFGTLCLHVVICILLYIMCLTGKARSNNICKCNQVQFNISHFAFSVHAIWLSGDGHTQVQKQGKLWEGQS